MRRKAGRPSRFRERPLDTGRTVGRTVVSWPETRLLPRRVVEGPRANSVPNDGVHWHRRSPINPSRRRWMRGKAEELRPVSREPFASRQTNAAGQQVRIPPVPGIHQTPELVEAGGSMVNTTHQDVQFLDVAKGPQKEEVSKCRGADGDNGTGNGLRPQAKQALEVQVRRVRKEVSP